MSQYELVDSDDTLSHIAAEWSQQSELAVDLECENNLHHYGTHLCLVQISNHTTTWIVDMLAITKPAPLCSVLESESVLKVFHDISFDFRMLEQKLGCRPKNIFDTKLASELLGKEKISIGSLFERIGVHKEKKFQKADWTRRPLAPDMLAYAADDTAHLLKIKNMLQEELVELGRIEWAQQEFKHIETLKLATKESEAKDIKGAKLLSGRQYQILRALHAEREKIAHHVDRPVHFIIPNKMLLSLAKNPPTPERWRTLRGVHPTVKRQVDRFMHAIARGQQAPPNKCTREMPKHLRPDQQLVKKALLEARAELAEKYNIEAHLFLGKEEMYNIINKVTPNGLRPWQQKLLGPYLRH